MDCEPGTEPSRHPILEHTYNLKLVGGLLASDPELTYFADRILRHTKAIERLVSPLPEDEEDSHANRDPH